jgi:hypothetical protein
VANTLRGKTATALLAKVKNGGTFASVTGAPDGAQDYPEVRVVSWLHKDHVRPRQQRRVDGRTRPSRRALLLGSERGHALILRDRRVASQLQWLQSSGSTRRMPTVQQKRPMAAMHAAMTKAHVK